jgi:hypothetical protein
MQESIPRALRRVVERIPVPVYLAAHYVSFYVRELLECGHEVVAQPWGDPLIAKQRLCPKCAQAEMVPPKKPVQSVREPSWRRRVA